MSNVLEMTKINLSEKRVLIREDFNVPIENGRVLSDARLKAAIPTLKYALDKNAAIILLSHLGRPEEGVFEESYSLRPVADRLNELCPDMSVRFVSDWLSGVDVKPGEVILCENVRFNEGEKKNNLQLAQKIANLGDVFVMDAFATAHRAEASTYGVAEFAKVACAGPLLVQELDALTKAFANPKHPLVAIVAGSKVSTKLNVLTMLIEKVDALILGGGIANTFLAAQGYEIGKSLYEHDLIEVSKKLLQEAKQKNVRIILPEDAVVATSCSKDSIGVIKSLNEIMPSEMVLDVGPKTSHNIDEVIRKANTIIWNGPLGVFEIEAFSEGTKALANAIAKSSAYSLAGGGDTLAAVEKYHVQNEISYLSTGGGAFLEFLENKTLPAIEILERRARERG